MRVLADQFVEVKSQLKANARLRIGLWLVLAIVWVNALFWHSDRLKVLKSDLDDLTIEISRLKPLQSSSLWEQRAQDAQLHLDALRSTQWRESSVGLIQAAVQDWLRQVCTKAGVSVRDVRLTSVESLGTQDLTERYRTNPGGGGVNPPRDSVKVRMVLDFSPMSLAVLLQEMSRNERILIVDRLQFRTWTPSPQAEIDVRASALLDAVAR